MEPALQDPANPESESVRRARAKERLYVAFQLGGWGAFFSIQTFFYLVFPEPGGSENHWRTVAAIGLVNALGLLLSDGIRRAAKRWGWSRVGWRRLLLRVLLASFLMSAAWSGLGYGYLYGVLRLPWTSSYSPGMAVTVSVVNGFVLFVVWFTFYFSYQLFDRFNRLEVEQLQLQAAVKEAEFRALKAQVNPHFIFNSLNSIRALVDEDPTRARRAITQLANLLRYSLQSGQLETVSFEDELRTVNDYLALEQVRHEERLRLRVDVAPETLQQPLPPMLLQTLVENAVKYGISNRPEGGEVAIEARRIENRLELRVTNPGELGAVQASTARASTGLGLRNASQRLRLLFGDAARCELQEQPRGTVVATVTIPVGAGRDDTGRGRDPAGSRRRLAVGAAQEDGR